MATDVTFRLKLLIDEKRNKVVLAEAEQDFVDVLLSLLTIPMGRIASLLEDHKTVLDCYKNLHKSVVDMAIGHFETQACCNMLMYPKSSKDIHRKRLKLNMCYNPPTEFFVCPNFFRSDSCGGRTYSNFKTSICSCGALMKVPIHVSEEEQALEVIGDVADGVFVNCRSSFIVTGDLKVTSNSIGVLMNVLKHLGYTGYSGLQETLVDVGFEEVVTLLGFLFTSEAPLTCTFLRKTCMTSKRMHEMLSPPALKDSASVCSVKVFVRKVDREILYAECSEDFIDSLLSFLVLPLEMACSLSNDNTILGCVGNLCKSQCRGAASKSCYLPGFYICSNNNLIDYAYKSTRYKCWIPHDVNSSYRVARFIDFDSPLSKSGNIASLYPTDPKVESEASSSRESGFMKEKTMFVVSNDLIITPMNSSSTIGLLKNMKVDINDLEEYQISVSKAELISILRASLISSSALTNGLSSLLVKNPKKET